MKIYKANRFLTLLLAFLFSFSMCACIPIKNLTNASDIPQQVDETYSGEIEPFTIRENKTIKLNGVTIEGTDADPSPITIESGVKVNIVLEGENTLTAYVKYKNDGSIDSSSPRCAGIYVQQGATLNIYEEDGGTLTVTGGYYGAGIGGVGTGGSNTGIPGIINIHSGTLYVQGGYQAAGIGSGRSSSGNKINIYGGDITAIAGNSGAGIGTGYGTSGGGDEKVGSYNGGEINITGGTVRAASGKFKQKDDSTDYGFDDFDIYDTDYFFENCYEANGYGAGIGGGYGAASGTITIGGNADVTAIGSCGGTGIGTGRGTSSTSKYSTGCTPVNITIKGNAKVVAATPNENRDKEKPGSGAAIGGGRGFNDGGTIDILGNANVTAVSTNYKNVQDIAYQDNAGSSYAAAIGGSWQVGKIEDEWLKNPSEHTAKPKTLNIAPTAIISAVSDGFVPAISFPEGQVSNSLILLKFTDDFFTNNKDVLDNEEIIKFPSKIVAEDLDNSNNKTTFSINKSSASCFVNLPGEKYRLKVLGENDKESIYLSHNVGNVEDSDEDRKNSAIFYNSKDTYDITGLTSPIEQETTIKFGDEDLKIKIRGREGIFEYGSIFHAESVTDSEEITQLNKDLDDEYENILERSHYYDIGVTHRKSDVAGESPEEYEEFKGGSVTISLQIPAGWDKDELLALYVKADEGDDETFNHRVETIDGVDYITFETKHFSKYALFDPDNKTYNPDDKTENPESQPTLPLFPLTGDNYNALVFGLLSIFFKSYLLLSVIYGRNNL